MNKLEETLIITAEECAEVIQEISKCFRFGIDGNHKSGVKHRAKLEEEIGDLLCMIDILIENGEVNPVSLDKAKLAKRDKLKVYSSLFNDKESQ